MSKPWTYFLQALRSLNLGPCEYPIPSLAELVLPPMHSSLHPCWSEKIRENVAFRRYFQALLPLLGIRHPISGCFVPVIPIQLREFFYFILDFKKTSFSYIYQKNKHFVILDMRDSHRLPPAFSIRWGALGFLVGARPGWVSSFVLEILLAHTNTYSVIKLKPVSYWIYCSSMYTSCIILKNLYNNEIIAAPCIVSGAGTCTPPQAGS